MSFRDWYIFSDIKSDAVILHQFTGIFKPISTAVQKVGSSHQKALKTALQNM